MCFSPLAAEKEEIKMTRNALKEGLHTLVDSSLVGKALIFIGGVTVGLSYDGVLFPPRYAALGVGIAAAGAALDMAHERYARWETTLDGSEASYDAARAEQRKGIHTV